MWIGIAGRLQSSIDALDAAAEVIAAAKEAVKEREGLQKIEITQLAEAMGEGRGTAHVRNALAKRHKRELRRLEENVLGEALATLGSFYRDVLALRSGAVEGIVNLDLVEALRPWAENDAVSDGALVRAVDRCLETRATFHSNPNAPLQIEATLLDLARLVPPPVTTDAWA
jgi:hypothetical protein